jgi:hypothetical protein
MIVFELIQILRRPVHREDEVLLAGEQSHLLWTGGELLIIRGGNRRGMDRQRHTRCCQQQ